MNKFSKGVQLFSAFFVREYEKAQQAKTVATIARISDSTENAVLAAAPELNSEKGLKVISLPPKTVQNCLKKAQKVQKLNR